MVADAGLALIELPTGSKRRQLGSGDPSLYVPIWFQKSVGKWTAYGGVGYRFNSGSGNRNAWAGGWIALYQLNERAQLGGEVKCLQAYLRRPTAYGPSVSISAASFGLQSTRVCSFRWGEASFTPMPRISDRFVWVCELPISAFPDCGHSARGGRQFFPRVNVRSCAATARDRLGRVDLFRPTSFVHQSKE